MRITAHVSGAVSILILSVYFVCNDIVAGRYWGILHSGSPTGFFAWMLLGLVFAMIATVMGSRWWIIAVVFFLASLYLLRPVLFACPVLRWQH